MTSKVYNIKEYIPSFQLQILLDLVDSIAKLENLSDKTQSQVACIEKKLNFIKHKCPILPINSIGSSSTQHVDTKKKGFKEITDRHHQGNHDEEDDLITDFDEYNRTHNLLLLSEEGQESAIALGYFLTLTKAKSNQTTEQILPLLIGLVNNLPHCKWYPRAKITGGML